MFRVCKRGFSFLCVSIYVSPSGLHSFRVPPFFDPDESIKQTPEDFIEWSGEGDVHLGFIFVESFGLSSLVSSFIHIQSARAVCIHTHTYIYTYTRTYAHSERLRKRALFVSLSPLSLLFSLFCASIRGVHIFKVDSLFV